MQDQVNAPAPKRVPWNKGKLTGAKPPLRPKHVWSIRTKLQIEGRVYEENPAPGVFRWHYLRGVLEKFTGETTPRDFSPCGVTLDLRTPVLAKHPERYYTWLVEAGIALPECLLVPLYVGSGEPLGTLWIVSPTEGHFDSGHARIMTELAAFAGMALRMVRTEDRIEEAFAKQQQLMVEQVTLTGEMSHRVQNLFAIFGGMVRVSARSAATPARICYQCSEVRCAEGRNWLCAN